MYNLIILKNMLQFISWIYHWLSLALFSALLVLQHHYPFETPHVDKAPRIFVLFSYVASLSLRLKLGVKAIIFQEGIFNVQSALNWTFKTFYPQVMRSSTCTAASCIQQISFQTFLFCSHGMFFRNRGGWGRTKKQQGRHQYCLPCCLCGFSDTENVRFTEWDHRDSKEGSIAVSLVVFVVMEITVFITT